MLLRLAIAKEFLVGDSFIPLLSILEGVEEIAGTTY
jgi:hypothetical protein